MVHYLVGKLCSLQRTNYAPPPPPNTNVTLYIHTLHPLQCWNFFVVIRTFTGHKVIHTFTHTCMLSHMCMFSHMYNFSLSLTHTHTQKGTYALYNNSGTFLIFYNYLPKTESHIYDPNFIGLVRKLVKSLQIL